MSKVTLVVYVNEDDDDFSNALWVSSAGLPILKREGLSVDILVGCGLERPPGNGIWKWVGEVDAADRVAPFGEGEWFELEDEEVHDLADAGVLDENAEEDEPEVPLETEEDTEGELEFSS